MTKNQTVSILMMAAMLSSCGNRDQGNAINEAKRVESAITKMQPGAVTRKRLDHEGQNKW
ncbi:MAG: hypothetical protein H0V63_02625 [Burkholderiaceae bacterium]|nr:hypothetical protein [Burkholderiaceae bacterium]